MKLATLAAIPVTALTLFFVRSGMAEESPADPEKLELRMELGQANQRIAKLERSRQHFRQGWLRRGRVLRMERRLVRKQFYTGVTHAMRLASVAWSVPFGHLLSVARCESGLYPFATNGRYRGIFQEGPMFERGPFGQAGFSVFDVYANVFTAAHTVSREGWSQWECKP